jgi:tetratricopeptide (TPR) repeat protein
MQWKTITLDLSEQEIQTLKQHNAKLIQHLEDHQPLKPEIISGLKEALTAAINQNAGFRSVMADLRHSGAHYAIQLVHDQNEILNLPWGMAIEQESQQPLAGIERLYLIKSLPQLQNKTTYYQPQAAAPLKVLVMLSSPEDSDIKSLLSYDEEEYEILKAFSPLLQTGAVQIDFTDDGSLETLKTKLKTNKYHMLHFSGHGLYKDNTGYLVLEDPLTLKTQLVKAEEFVNALNCNPDHKIPLVLLSSCQTAQGTTEKGLQGLTNQLLQSGVPAVIAMGMSIQDRYAALFAAHFYQELAQKQNVLTAFNAATLHIRDQESENNRQNPVTANQIPLQWIIPQLYLNTPIEHLVDWDKVREELAASYQFLIEQNRLVLKHDNNYRFIGRRKDKAAILGPFFAKTPVLLKGQGGVGKTAMAEHLVQRLIAHNPNTYPFVFNEKTRSIKEILDSLQNYLIIEHGQTDVILALNSLEKAMDKLNFLLNKLSQVCQPVFIFDNLETFQSEPGKAFAPNFQDLAEVIGFFCQCHKYHLILTCRYPVSDFKNVQSFDLNQVSFNDFWKKCNTLALSAIHTQLLEQSATKLQTGILERSTLTFEGFIKLLYKTFGGNYRALEFFDKLFITKPETFMDSLNDLEILRQKIADTNNEVTEYMGQNLVFEQLLSLLDKNQQEILCLLAQFRIPVQILALKMQLPDSLNMILSKILESLNDLTLLEISLDRDFEAIYYYITPLVKNLMQVYNQKILQVSFDCQKAGLYHYHICENIDFNLADLEEAFYYFYQVLDKQKVNEIGEQLSKIYHSLSMFQNAYYYCRQTYGLLKEDTNIDVLNRLGQILYLYGKYDDALLYFKQALSGWQEISDKSGEGTNLNNISQIYDAKGDYDTALRYLEQSLRISQEIGDKSGMIPTLHNISSIQLFQKKDMEKYLEYEVSAYSLAQEINDAMGIYKVGKNFGSILCMIGKVKEGIPILQKCLSIGQAAGYPDVAKIAELLKEYDKNGQNQT